MHVVLWSYRVVPGREDEFEALYYSTRHYVRLKDEYLDWTSSL